MTPPIGVLVHVRSKEGKGFGMWFPVVLLWLPMALLMVPLLPCIVLAELVLRVRGRPIRLLAMVGGLWAVLAALRGLQVRVKSTADKAKVLLHFS